MAWNELGLCNHRKQELHGLWCKTITRNSGPAQSIWRFSQMTFLRECEFCGAQNSVQLSGFEVLKQLETLHVASFGSVCFKNSWWKDGGFLGKGAAEDQIGALDHRDVQLLQGPSLSATFSTFSLRPKCAPDVQKQRVRSVLIWGFCSSCIYFLIARYPES